MKKFISITLVIIIPLLFSFLFDRFLIFFGYPSDKPIIYMHPKNLNQKRTNIEFEYSFNTNNQGIRYREIPLEKANNENRIFLLGDSFTEGYGVAAEKGFGSLLEVYFNSTQKKLIQFINGGLAGAGPVEYLKVFQKVGLKYNVDGLLICLFANDVSDMPESETPEDIHTLYQKRRGMKKLLHNLYPRIYTMIEKLIDRYIYKSKTETSDFVSLISKKALQTGISSEKITKWKKTLPKDLVLAVNRGEFNGRILSFGLLYPQIWTDTLNINTESAEKKYRSMIAVLQAIIDKAKNHGIETAIVYIPWKTQYDPSSHDPDDIWIKTGTFVNEDWLRGKSELQKRLEKWTFKNQLPFLDLTPVFRKKIIKNTHLNYALDGHWTPDGHKIAGTAISNWIETNQVFSFIK